MPLMSPTTRRTNAVPSTVIAMPRALPAPLVSCAATAPTAANTHPPAVNSRPRARIRWRAAPGRHAQGEDRAEHQVRPERHQQRRGEPRVPAERGGAEQLAAAGLLLGSGVPDHGEEADEPDHHGDEARAPGDQLAQARAGQRTVERDEAGIVRAGVGVPLPSGGRREELVDRGDVGKRDDADEHDPQRHQHPVAPQDQTDQPAAAGQLAHWCTILLSAVERLLTHPRCRRATALLARPRGPR